jgi:hypothetical protein
MIILSQPYGECYDCGSPMTAVLDVEDCSLNVYRNGTLSEVYVSCDGCGGRAGHREYQPHLHGESL